MAALILNTFYHWIRHYTTPYIFLSRSERKKKLSLWNTHFISKNSQTVSIASYILNVSQSLFFLDISLKQCLSKNTLPCPSAPFLLPEIGTSCSGANYTPCSSVRAENMTGCITGCSLTIQPVEQCCKKRKKKIFQKCDSKNGSPCVIHISDAVCVYVCV